MMKHNYTTVSLRPYASLTPSVHAKGYAFLLVLLPHVLMLFLTRSWGALGVVAGAVLASVAVAGIACFFSPPRTFGWIAALVRGLVIGLLIPSSYPAVSVFLIVLCVLLVCEHILGGFADTWVNPVALTVAVCWLVRTDLFPAFSLSAEDLQVKNVALTLIQNGTFPTMGIDARITAFLNKNVFGLFGVSVPEGYVSLLWDSHASVPAFRFNLITLVTSIFLISFDLIKALIPAVYLAVYCLLVRFLAPVWYGGTVGQGDMLFALLTSGTLFCTLFLLQWYGTTPVTAAGKAVYGFFAGIIAFLIIGVGDSGAGSAFTVLVMNVVAPVIVAAETAAERQYLHTVLLPRVQAHKDGHHA